MPSKYESQLKNKAGEFISFLSNQNILADIIPDSLRDYSVKIEIKDTGTISLFYSPNKNSFKITLQEVRKRSLIREIESYWNEFSGNEVKEYYKDKGIEIDVDGSYQDGVTTFGCVIRKNGKIINEISGVVDNVEVDGSHQVAGEIKAVTESVKWCIENSIKDVTIYHDYNGLEMWAKGIWKTKKQVSKNYSEFMRIANIRINWVKIESHTGVKWNEYADKLAKNASRLQ
jgi:ribonuclease HI